VSITGVSAASSDYYPVQGTGNVESTVKLEPSGVTFSP
jgi:hypothetical protein